MNDQRRSMKTYTLMGFVGGIIFVIGDCLIFCYKGYSNLGIIWKVVFKDTVVVGAWGACESMGEALVFLTAAIYWRKKNKVFGGL